MAGSERCSHGPVGRLPSVKSSVDLDRPQAGGYKDYQITLAAMFFAGLLRGTVLRPEMKCALV